MRLPWATIILYFNKKVKPFYHPEQGRDMLMLALAFEVCRMGVMLVISYMEASDVLSNGLVALIFLLLIYSVTRYVFPIKLKDIGLHKLSKWNAYETAFLLGIVPIVFCLFFYYTKDKLYASLHEQGRPVILITFICYMAFGFYQEWIYRGFIQTEFTRRYGAITAILLANLIFTFGPLHIYQLYQGRYMFIAITFFIGLLFGILYYRSYNLWITGILHGICIWFLTGLP